jgi:hypothetical protein
MRTKLHRIGRTRRRRISGETFKMCFAVVVATARDTTENPVLCSPRGSFQVGSGIREGWSFREGEKTSSHKRTESILFLRLCI